MSQLFQLDIIAPDRILRSERVEMVVIPGAEGDFGVLPGHAPLISALRPGLLNIHSGTEIKEQFFVSGGFAEVSNNSCIILADRATPLSEIKRNEVVSRIENIKSELQSSNSNNKELLRELNICEAMLAVAA
jgi:F-type H+-transporting ATPase subunit epsilon